jgi:phage tail sheath gpL-like
VLCDSDATNIGRVVTQVNTQANPTTGIRQRVFAGTVDTLANATTLATGLNAPRCEITWGSATDITPLELAANSAAIYSLFEQSGNTGYRLVGRLNFSQFPTANPRYQDASYWFLTATRNGPNSGPSTVQITSALNNGLTPLAILPDGTLQHVKRCTTRSLNGSTADYRIRDAHKVAIMDAWAGAAAALTIQQFGGMDLLDAPPTGANPQGGNPPTSFATNVTVWGNALKDLTEKVGIAGLLQYTDVTNANAIIQREASPRTRMSASFDLTTADIADQFALLANQVG